MSQMPPTYKTLFTLQAVWLLCLRAAVVDLTGARPWGSLTVDLRYCCLLSLSCSVLSYDGFHFSFLLVELLEA